jgi:hypothetical protein
MKGGTVQLSVIQTTLISAITTVASVALALGVFSATAEQVIVSAAGTLIGLGFSLSSELNRRTRMRAAIALDDRAALMRIVRR